MAFKAPIPGMSLTKGVGDSPWQQPPLYNTPEEALAFYFKKFDDPDTLDDVLFSLEQGFALETFVDSITSAGVMNGYHTVDVKVLISPVLHEHFRLLAEAAGIKIKEFAGPSREEKLATRDKDRIKLLIKSTLEKPVNPSDEEIAQAKEEMAEAPSEHNVKEESAEGLMPLIQRRK